MPSFSYSFLCCLPNRSHRGWKYLGNIVGGSLPHDGLGHRHSGWAVKLWHGVCSLDQPGHWHSMVESGFGRQSTLSGGIPPS